MRKKFDLGSGLKWPWWLLILLVSLNLGVSVAVREIEIFYIQNQDPFGLPIGFWPAVLILIFVSVGLWKLGLWTRYPLFAALVLAGGWSNILERVWRGGVTDYIPFIFSYINLADLQIWLGLLAINWWVWFGEREGKNV